MLFTYNFLFTDKLGMDPLYDIKPSSHKRKKKDLFLDLHLTVSVSLIKQP